MDDIKIEFSRLDGVRVWDAQQHSSGSLQPLRETLAGIPRAGINQSLTTSFFPVQPVLILDCEPVSVKELFLQRVPTLFRRP